MDRRTRAMLAAVTVTVLVTSTAGVASARTSAPQTLAVLEQKILAGLSAGDWRNSLSSLLAQAATARPDLSLTGSAHGALLGGTVHLPSTLALDGETTIVAQRIVLSSPTLRVTGSHPLRLYPVVALTVAGQAQAAVITIDRSGTGGSQGLTGSPGVNGEVDHRGTPGNQGFTGATGLTGATGSAGLPGEDALIIDEEDCEPATSGRSGGPGSSGTGGGQGTPGGDAGAGTDITLDIPDGSTDIYFLRANGGTGGQGGQGGQGGPGGWGGAGGRGGNGFALGGSLSCAFGGNGGWGGPAGNGGAGGQGGRGGQGGHGGDIAVTYPANYDPANIHAFVDGGVGGLGGLPGNGGFGGRGGLGGLRGQSAGGFPTFDGLNGVDGADGSPGTEGAAGIKGEDGAVDMTQRTLNDDICAGMQSQPEDYADLRETYHNLLATDPFPAEEPPESALPNCEEPPAPAKIKGARDVAFGDSFISGEGAPPFDTNPQLSPTAATKPACHVSLTSWVALVHTTGRLLPGGQQGFQNWACSGANIADADQQVTNAIAAAEANGGSPVGLGVNTKAVQIMVGGNDVRNGNLVGLGQIVACALQYGATHSKDAPPSGCLPHHFDVFNDQLPVLKPRWINLYQRIAQAAPNAIIEVVGYPFLFPTRRPRVGVGGCTTGLVTADEGTGDMISFILGVGLHNAVKDTAARGIRIRYVPLMWALANHNVCPTRDGRNGTRRNTHGVNVPGNSDCGITETVCWFHPNNAGHRAMYVAYTRTSTVKFRNTASLVPPSLDNGTLVAEVSSNSVYVAAGGTLFPFNDPADISAAGYTYQPGTLPQLDPGQVALMTGPPANGTVLTDAGTGTHYAIGCGYKTPTAVTAGAVSVPSHVIADIPDGGCPVTLTSDRGVMWAGQTVTYTITGTARAPIYWTSTIYGQPSGEDNAFYNQYTDENGRFTFTMTWTDPRLGLWTRQVKVGGQTAQWNHLLDPPPQLLTQATLTAVHTEPPVNAGKCLDVFNRNDGAEVHQWACQAGNTWQLNPVGDGIYQVVNLYAGKCLDVIGSSLIDGTDVQLWTCNGGTNQQWRLSAIPLAGQVVILTAVHSGKCLDIEGASLLDGAKAQQYTCHGGTNQQWRLNAPPPPPIPPGPPPPPPPGEFE